MRKLFLALVFTLWSGVAVAGIYWLPDYLKDNIDTNHRTDTAPAGSGDIPLGCEKYSPKCSSPHILGGIEVRAAGELFCPVECVCPAAYKYTSANCSGDKKLAGSACDGKYNDCVAKSCAEKGLKDCNGSCIAKSACCSDGDCSGNKTCSDYHSSYRDSRQAGYYCPQVNAASVGSLTCYTCSQTCEKQFSGYTKGGNCADGQTPIAGTGGCADWIKCTGEACPAKLSCDYGCIKKNTRPECGNEYCIEECNICENCPDYPLAACPDGAVCTTCSKTCNTAETKYKFTKCNTGYIANGAGSCRKLTCADAGEPVCPTGQECKNGTCVITSCTNDPSICSNTQKCSNGKCVAKTCSDYYYSYVAAIPAKNRCTQVAASEVGNLTCYKGCQLYAEILYSDKTTSVNEIAGKTPIGVVVDSSKRLAAALVYEGYQWEAADNAKVISGKTKLKNLSGLADLGSGSTKTSVKGKANTKIIYDSCSNCSAARYAYEYTTAGTRKGDWFLPDTGELWLMYQNRDAVNRTLSSLGKKKVFTGYSEYTSYNYASAESSSTNRGNSDKVKIPTAWGLKLDGTFSTISKHLYHRAHPMITY